MVRKSAVFLPDKPVGEDALDIAPYLFPDVYFSRALGLPAGDAAESVAWLQAHGVVSTATLLLDTDQTESLRSVLPKGDIIDELLSVQERYDCEIFTFETEKIDKAIGPFLNTAMHQRGIYLNIDRVTPSKSKTVRGRSIKAKMKACPARQIAKLLARTY